MDLQQRWNFSNISCFPVSILRISLHLSVSLMNIDLLTVTWCPNIDQSTLWMLDWWLWQELWENALSWGVWWLHWTMTNIIKSVILAWFNVIMHRVIRLRIIACCRCVYTVTQLVSRPLIGLIHNKDIVAQFGVTRIVQAVGCFHHHHHHHPTYVQCTVHSTECTVVTQCTVQCPSVCQRSGTFSSRVPNIDNQDSHKCRFQSCGESDSQVVEACNFQCLWVGVGGAGS